MSLCDCLCVGLCVRVCVCLGKEVIQRPRSLIVTLKTQVCVCLCKLPSRLYDVTFLRRCSSLSHSSVSVCRESAEMRSVSNRHTHTHTHGLKCAHTRWCSLLHNYVKLNNLVNVFNPICRSNQGSSSAQQGPRAFRTNSSNCATQRLHGWLLKYIQQVGAKLLNCLHELSHTVAAADWTDEPTKPTRHHSLFFWFSERQLVCLLHSAPQASVWLIDWLICHLCRLKRLINTKLSIFKDGYHLWCVRWSKSLWARHNE